jgi:hypothetical protein
MASAAGKRTALESTARRNRNAGSGNDHDVTFAMSSLSFCIRGFLHIPAKRFNPGSRRQSGLGSDPDFSQFPNDFVHVHRLWLFTEFVASV